MEHLLAAHAGHPGDHIGDDVIAHVAHVQVPRGIGEHREGVVGVSGLCRGLGPWRCMGLLAIPVLLPALFDGLGLVPGRVAHCRLSRAGPASQADGLVVIVPQNAALIGGAFKPGDE